MADNGMATEREKEFYRSIEPGLEEYSSELKLKSLPRQATAP